jgi:hypothetical protein
MAAWLLAHAWLFVAWVCVAWFALAICTAGGDGDEAMEDALDDVRAREADAKRRSLRVIEGGPDDGRSDS